MFRLFTSESCSEPIEKIFADLSPFMYTCSNIAVTMIVLLLLRKILKNVSPLVERCGSSGIVVEDWNIGLCEADSSLKGLYVTPIMV